MAGRPKINANREPGRIKQYYYPEVRSSMAAQ